MTEERSLLSVSTGQNEGVDKRCDLRSQESFLETEENRKMCLTNEKETFQRGRTWHVKRLRVEKDGGYGMYRGKVPSGQNMRQRMTQSEGVETSH